MNWKGLVCTVDSSSCVTSQPISYHRAVPAAPAIVKDTDGRKAGAAAR